MPEAERLNGVRTALRPSGRFRGSPGFKDLGFQDLGVYLGFRGLVLFPEFSREVTLDLTQEFGLH